MRIFIRLSILVLALFLAFAPTFALAQNTGGGTSGGTTSGTTTGGGTSGSAGAGTSGNATTGSSTTTTTTDTTMNNLPWTWIVVGAVVLVVIVGLVAMSNSRGGTTSTTIRRE